MKKSDGVMKRLDVLLKSAYFPSGSKARLQARILSLLIYIPLGIMLFDLIENYEEHSSVLMYTEWGILAILITVIVLFPHFLSLKAAARIVFGVFTIFLFMTLYFPDNNAELSLFWFAVLPWAVFFFFDPHEAVMWSIIVTVLFLVVIFLTLFEYIHPIYSAFLIAQVMLGHIIVSFIVYLIEIERRRFENHLRTSIEKNKLLLKEVRHRTKNNMQVMLGLLETQAFKSDNPECQKMLLSHVDRIKAMSYVHEYLHYGTDAGKIRIKHYLGEILVNLQKITKHAILFDIADIELHIKEATNLGLIVNEAVSNAIEHAYEHEVGRIDVTLKAQNNGFVLNIRDYGEGFNPYIEHNSLGIGLITDLSEALPNGSVFFDTHRGTHITIYFTERSEL